MLLAGLGCLGNIGGSGSLDNQGDGFGGSGTGLTGNGDGGTTSSSGIGGYGSSSTSSSSSTSTSSSSSSSTSSGTGGSNTGGSGGQAPVDCSGIAANPSYELCDQSTDHCEGVFTNGAGCQAFCAAAGLDCTASFGGEPNCQKEGAPLDCQSTGHQSDWCVCGNPSTQSGNCPTDPNNPPAAAELHYTAADYQPRSSWALQCKNYAYTAQYAEHEQCDNLYQAGSGEGTATFLLNVNPGEYEVLIEGRHTINRNPNGMRTVVTNGSLQQVEYIMQRDNSGALQFDLHGTYCLDGQVQVFIDSSMNGNSDSVARVRIQPK